MNMSSSSSSKKISSTLVDLLDVMGNQSIKSSKTTKKKASVFCCLCTSTCSIDEKSDRYIQTNNEQISSGSIEDDRKLSLDASFESNRSLANLIHKFQLKFYLKDYLHRLKTSPENPTLTRHFSSSTIIYPCNGLNQILVNLSYFLIVSPPESILPNFSKTIYNSSIIHEQVRAKCYFLLRNDTRIDPFDQSLQSSYMFVSDDFFQTGLIRINSEKIPREFLPFLHHSSEDNLVYLSSNLLYKWFHNFILVNQTCAIAKGFLSGDHHRITCLFQEQDSSVDQHLIFAVFRQSNCTSPSDEKFLDAFSSSFLSDNEKLSPHCVHIDYEHYSFALILARWPKVLIETYCTHPQRKSTRRWPSEEQMKMITEKSLLIIPNYSNNRWRIQWDLIEEYLFQLMNESTLFFYLLCQKFFTQSYSQRRLIKHAFLNFCEKYGLPFSKKRKNHITDLIKQFLEDFSKCIKKKFLPDYFNHQHNLLHLDEDYQPWLDCIDRYFYDHISYSMLSSSFIANSIRPMICQYFFHFTEQLFQNFRQKQSEFSLNDSILLDLHRQLSQNDLLLDPQTIEIIQRNLTSQFEINAELVHTCLNQIRKSQTSLIFHYTWTIFIQYLHTYYNVLWNL